MRKSDLRNVSQSTNIYPRQVLQNLKERRTFFGCLLGGRCQINLTMPLPEPTGRPLTSMLHNASDFSVL